MDVTRLALPGAFLLTPVVHRDDRGYFTRTFDAATGREIGIDPAALVQDSQSRSRRGALRGLHVRAGGGEAKLVRVAHGRILDVLVDLRPSSPTFEQVVTVPLDDLSHVTLVVPRGVAHGWQALSQEADVCYRIDAEHDPGEDVTIRWDDPDLAVPWPEPPSVMSERDAAADSWADVRERLAAEPPRWWDEGGFDE